MIVRMIRVRIAGPRSRLDRTLTVLQDLGVLHVDRPHMQDDRTPDRAVMHERRHAEQCLSDGNGTRPIAAGGRPEGDGRDITLAGEGCPSCAPGPPPRRRARARNLLTRGRTEPAAPLS